MKSLLLSIFLTTPLLLYPFVANAACKCSPEDEDIKEAYKQADAVFLGTVNHLSINYFPPEIPATIFRVKEIFKGGLQKEVAIATIMDGENCDITFWEERDYLVYANKQTHGFYRATICSRTNFAYLVEDEIATLREFLKLESQLPKNLDAIYHEMIKKAKEYEKQQKKDLQS